MDKIEIKTEGWINQHKEIWEKLVPKNGQSETVQGELIRIIGKIEYELLDNGAMNWDDDYIKMVKSIKYYFSMGNSLNDNLQSEALQLANNINENTNKKDLYRLNELIVKWIINNPILIKLDKIEYMR